MRNGTLSSYYSNSDANSHAGIRSRWTRNGKQRTETYRRDAGINVAASTNPRTNTTDLFIDLDDGQTVRLSGREARTIFRVLSRHYTNTDKSTEF